MYDKLSETHMVTKGLQKKWLKLAILVLWN